MFKNRLEKSAFKISDGDTFKLLPVTTQRETIVKNLTLTSISITCYQLQTSNHLKFNSRLQINLIKRQQ